MKNIKKNPDGSYTIILYLKDDFFKKIKKLSRKLSMNEFEVIKYCIQLVSWWSKNEIEMDE